MGRAPPIFLHSTSAQAWGLPTVIQHRGVRDLGDWISLPNQSGQSWAGCPGWLGRVRSELNIRDPGQVHIPQARPRQLANSSFQEGLLLPDTSWWPSKHALAQDHSSVHPCMGQE